MSGMERYKDLSRDELVARIAALESSQASTSRQPSPGSSLTTREVKKAEKRRQSEKKANAFDIRRYPCRKIALRFSYDGASYNGLATQRHTPGTREDGSEGRPDIVTVEDVLWSALVATRLVGEKDRMGDVGWSRCGRTDRGVSSGGQVVALWVRSRKVDQWKEREDLVRFVDKKKREQARTKTDKDGSDEDDFIADEAQRTNGSSLFHYEGTRLPTDPDAEELGYVSTLNNVLPSTIRIQAWSPIRPHFSSRFDCRYRHYKYFFTSGCPFLKQTTTRGPSPQLDIQLMRLAAQKFLGDHDFRNFCKVDPSKQIDNYRRRIDGISIDLVSDSWPQISYMSSDKVISSNGVRLTDEALMTDESGNEQMYVLNLRGTAFLYHQVRHMMAVLFLVGARLEKPSIIDELLNVNRGAVARDRLQMRMRGLVIHDYDQDNIERHFSTTLPQSTATTMTGKVASDMHLDATSSEETILGKHDDFGDGVKAITATMQDLVIFDQKPEYEMAADRPLMLWECGFKSSDIQWRSGTYDGPLPDPTVEVEAEDVSYSGDINSSTATTAALLHSHWTSLAVTTAMYKHFLLALPIDPDPGQSGFLPASTYFDQSANPSLNKASVIIGESSKNENGSASKRQILSGSGSAPPPCRIIAPLGDGHFKALQIYKGLVNAKREQTPETKNTKYLLGRGKRRAEKKAIMQIEADDAE